MVAALETNDVLDSAYVSIICHSGNRPFKLSLCLMISPPFARFAAPERSSVRGFA